MNEWIKALAAEYTPSMETGLSGKRTKLNITFASDDVNVDQVYNLLVSNGIPVLDINTEIVPTKKELQPGDMVKTECDIVASTNALIKTPTKMYSVTTATIPSGYIGQVKSMDKTAACVCFDANITVEAIDQSGYHDQINYYVDTVTIDKDKLSLV